MGTQIEWQIIDDNGVIHSGNEFEMETAWEVMNCNSLDEYCKIMADMDIELISPENIGSLEENWNKYNCNFSGDLKLIEIHKIHR